MNKAEKINGLNKICQKFLEQKEDEKYLLLTEKLIDLSLDYMEENQISSETFEFKIDEKITEFIQKTNLKMLELYNQPTNNSEDDFQIFAKCIDLFSNEKLKKVFEKNMDKLYELKILSFNNLSCIHRKKHNFQVAFKAVSLALKLEKTRLKLNPNKLDCVKNIVSTYMNQAVICSEMRKHEKSVQIIELALERLDNFERFLKDEKNKESQTYNENYQEFLYLKMVASFNIAVENEYLFNQSKSIAFYEEALSLAQDLKNTDIIRKSEIALTKLNKIVNKYK